MFDVIVVGGGLVGTSQICALQKLGLKVALIDHSKLETHKISSSARALALTLSSQRFFESLDLWDVLKEKSEAILEVKVSQKKQFGVVHLRAKDEKLPALGYVINADHLINTLENFISSKISSIPNSNLKIFRPEKIQKLKFINDEYWQIELESNTVLKTKLLIAADGTESFIRKQLGIGVITKDYHQTAILTNLVLSKSHDGIAHERFTDSGPIALLPFGDQTSAKCVWVTHPAEAKYLKEASKEEFLKKSQQTFGFSAGVFKESSERILYPLKSIRSENIYTHSLVFIGNAANTLHPVGGQGFNLGVRDIVVLTDIIQKAIHNQQDIGDMEVLQAYANRRNEDHHRTFWFTDRLASTEKSHTLGILLTEFIGPLKHTMIRFSTGFASPAPI